MYRSKLIRSLFLTRQASFTFIRVDKEISEWKNFRRRPDNSTSCCLFRRKGRLDMAPTMLVMPHINSRSFRTVGGPLTESSMLELSFTGLLLQYPLPVSVFDSSMSSVVFLCQVVWRRRTSGQRFKSELTSVTFPRDDPMDRIDTE